ncbi:MAG: FAD-dependent oxidoreductase [Verrucomicrobiota bacterium]
MNESFDIAVVGSGAAGIAAAVSAARAGAKTLLLDQRGSVGGIGGGSGLTTLCGLHDSQGNFINGGFAREFAEALQNEDQFSNPVKKMGRLFVQHYRPVSFQKIAARFLANERLLTTRWNSGVRDVSMRGNRLHRLNEMEVAAVIDCSGDAVVGRLAGEKILSTDDSTQASAVIFTLEEVEADFHSPLVVAQILSALAHAGFPPAHFLSGCESNLTTVKYSGTPETAPALITFLKTKVPGFSRSRALQTQFTAERRAGSMIEGHYLLRGEDVLGAKKFPDAVARNHWPIEQWSADGRQKLRYLPGNDFYEIPARSLRAARTENLFMAGKTLSADVDAVASARVMGCCLATGAAAGLLAADWVQSHTAR